jgi:Flp pilus assembly protein protease CpaA
MLTTLWNTNLPLLQWGVVIGASTVAAVWDVKQHRIPNILTGPLFLGGLVWSVWVGSWAGAGESLLACVILAAPYIWLFLFAGGGAGDAKMMGAIGVWLGFTNGLAALVGVSLAGVAFGAFFLIRRRGLSFAWTALIIGLGELSQRLLGSRGQKPKQCSAVQIEPMAKMPYGLAIWSGVCLAAAGVKLWRLQT